ncbi:hypothetical protein DXG01_001226 [Tephrocybe rancida]|nr:hypothetical protein DXG01_001226 [Tephrocybe rancida]
MQIDRTVLVVLWFQDGKRPLRLDQPVACYPKLQLTSSPKLLRDLGITADSYIDIWVGEWLTTSISTIIDFENNDRILLRLRPNLRTEITDCPELDKELLLQPTRGRPAQICTRGDTIYLGERPVLPSPSLRTNSHSGSGFPSPVGRLPSSHNHHSPPPSYADSSQTSFSKPGNSKPPPSSHPSSKPDNSKPLSTSQLSFSKSANPKPPSTSELTAKRWPHDFYVCDIENGLQKMGALRDEDQAITIPQAFAKSFKDAPFVRTTVYKYLKKWPEYDSDIKAQFVDYGRTSRGLCVHFIHMVTKPRMFNPMPTQDSPSLLSQSLEPPSRHVSRSGSRPSSRSSSRSRSRSSHPRSRSRSRSSRQYSRSRSPRPSRPCSHSCFRFPCTDSSHSILNPLMQDEMAVVKVESD